MRQLNHQGDLVSVIDLLLVRGQQQKACVILAAVLEVLTQDHASFTGLTVGVVIDKDKAVILGGGPTLHELQADLQQLKAANAELRRQVQDLRAEVERLKKQIEEAKPPEKKP